MLFIHDQQNLPKKWSAICGRPGGIKLTILYVAGVINLPTPCHKAKLIYRVPQGVNPRILLLELVVTDPGGKCIQKIEPTPVGFSMVLPDCNHYDEVEIIGIAHKIAINKY